MRPPSRVAQFHVAVDERFSFLLKRGFRVVERVADERYNYANVLFAGEGVRIFLDWEAGRGGDMQAKLCDKSLWPMLAAEGLWRDSGYDYSGYSIEAMQHGLDRVATFLKGHENALGLLLD